MFTIRSIHSIRFCPHCGRKVERESFPVRSLPDGSVVKTNVRVECPEHGEITVSPQ